MLYLSDLADGVAGAEPLPVLLRSGTTEAVYGGLCSDRQYTAYARYTYGHTCGMSLMAIHAAIHTLCCEAKLVSSLVSICSHFVLICLNISA